MGSDNLVWDWNLHCPVLISNVIFRTLVPEESLASSKIKLASIKSKYQVRDYEVVPFGGITEGVNIPPVQQSRGSQWIHDDDIHILLIHKEFTLSPPSEQEPHHTAFAEVEETAEGLVKLKLNDPDSIHPSLIHTEPDGTAYLRADPFLSGIPDFKTGEILPYPEIDLQDVQNRNVSTPAWKHTCAFKYPQWPTSASEWLTRKRSNGFPSEQLIKGVEKEGCLLVPRKGKPSSGAALTWKYSYLNAGRTLMNSLSPLQKHIFTILRVLCFQKLSTPRVIENHHLRSLYLHLCEQVPAPMWRPEQLTQLLMYAVDHLLHLLINNSLPHYFNKSINLLGGLSEDFLDQTQGTLADLRVGALEVLLDFSQEFHFQDVPTLGSSVYEPVRNITDKSFIPENSTDCMSEVLIPFLMRYTRAHVDHVGATASPKEFEALKAFQRLLERCLKETGLSAGDIVWHLAMREFRDELFWQIRVHEYIVEFVTSCQNPIAFKSNLACLYHTAYSQGHEEYKEKAQKMFEACCSAPDVHIANKTDYAVFLCKTESWELAAGILCEIIEAEATADANSYDEQEMPTLEVGLQDLGRAMGGLDLVPARSHAFYLLLITYTNLGKDQATIDGIFSRFTTWCQSQAEDLISTALLALALEKSCKYKEALEMYKTASVKGKGSEGFELWVTKKQAACSNLLQFEDAENGTGPREAGGAADGYGSQNGEGGDSTSGRVGAEEAGAGEVTVNQPPVVTTSSTAIPLPAPDDLDEELQKAIAMSLRIN